MVNFPKGSSSNFNLNKITHANRGMNLEYELEITNNYYKNNNICLVYKRPVPIKILQVDKINNIPIIKRASFEAKSTTDYQGVYKGFYIDFEAKETRNLNYFSIANIKKHQLDHFEKVIENKGFAFIIIRFVKKELTYFLKAEYIFERLSANIKNIDLKYLEKNGYLISGDIKKPVDYVKILRSIL